MKSYIQRISAMKPITPIDWPEPMDSATVARIDAWIKKKRRKAPKQQEKAKYPFQQKQNEDGYLMKFCTYEPLENRFIYRPPGYGIGKQQKPHCCLCHLKPCVVEEYLEETNQCFFDLQIQKGVKDAVAQEKTLTFLHRKYCKVLKQRYLKKLLPPQCIADSISGFVDFFDNQDGSKEKEKNNAVDEEEEEEEDEEATFQFQSDGAEAEEGDEDSQHDDDSFDVPIAVLGNHEYGDIPIDDKVRLYHLKKAQQEAVNSKLFHDSKPVVVQGVKRKSISELLAESSDEEYEF